MKIGLGGGCHWCTEAVFQAIAGISRVDQGFVRSDPPEDAWSEAVIVTFDPEALPTERLIEIHLRTHASTSRHRLRGKYRSAVYVYDAGTGGKVAGILRKLQKEFDAPLVTCVLALADFRRSDPRFRDYYASGPERPFCRSYIDPKLALLRQEFAKDLKPKQVAAE